MKLFKSLLFTLTVTATAIPVHASKIMAGSASGSYTNSICPEVQKALKSDYFDYKCSPSAGSIMSVETVSDNQEYVGMGQLDAVMLKSNTERLEIFETELHECLYAVTNDPNITNVSSLSSRAPAALPSIKSGSTGTFLTLQELDDSFKSLTRITHYENASEAVDSVFDGTNAIAFFVQMPDPNNKLLKKINDIGLRFLPVISRPILRAQHDGKPVYRPMTVSVTKQGLLASLTAKPKPVIETACTPIVLFTGKADGYANADDHAAMAKLLSNFKLPVTGDSPWKNILSGVKSIDIESALKQVGLK